MAERLWAKSWNSKEDGPAPPHVFLPQHLRDVLAAADAVLDATAEQQLRAFGLEPALWIERFRQVVRLAAAVHDLGKANDHFQGMILRRADRIGRPQGLRHEWVTWWMLQDESLGGWLKPALGKSETSQVDWMVMLWAVTGHHAAFGRASPPTDLSQGVGSEMRLHLAHEDFRDCLRLLADEFLSGELTLPRVTDLKVDLRSVLDHIGTETLKQSQVWELSLSQNRELLAFTAAVKNCLVAADVAGSAIPIHAASDDSRRDWVRRAFAEVPSRSELDEVIASRLTKDGAVQPLRPFQEEVANRAGDVTLVKAGCGSGKTLAGYHWLRTRHLGKRLYLCYPTTGTATEGFRDYVFDESEKLAKCGARLFHGRSDVDERLILGVTDRSDETDDDDGLARIESLDTWSTPIVVCTVDAVLGVMQNNRRGLYAWPALAGATFVFDEIHAFDSELFGALLRFVRDLRGVPILLMTASLPESRLKRLREVVTKRGSALVEIGGPEELETLPRYHRGPEVPEDVALVRLVGDEYRRTDRPGKILWVCNTVNRAMDAADRCSANGLEPLIYHSRFRYEDRVRQHANVIASFKDDHGSSLAICTQVAEMSLDLSATLLVTDLAPISSLIQRLGRLNRRARTRDNPTMQFVVVTPNGNDGKLAALPYSDDELLQAQQWLAALPASISQRDLVLAWETRAGSPQCEQIKLDSMWLDGGPRREVKELRKGSPGITVILQDDLTALRSADAATRKSLGEVLLPMPRPFFPNWREWPEYQGIKITPNGFLNYDKKRGGSWSTENREAEH